MSYEVPRQHRLSASRRGLNHHGGIHVKESGNEPGGLKGGAEELVRFLVYLFAPVELAGHFGGSY